MNGRQWAQTILVAALVGLAIVILLSLMGCVQALRQVDTSDKAVSVDIDCSQQRASVRINRAAETDAKSIKPN